MLGIILLGIGALALIALRQWIIITSNLKDQLGIKVFDHTAIVVWSIDEALPRLKDLGWIGGDHKSKQPNNGRNLTTLTHPDWVAKLEVLEPSGPGSYLAPFLQKFGPWRQHHLTFYVEKDLDEVRQILLARGFGLHEDRPHEVIIHPKGGGGTMIQFFPADRRWGRTRNFGGAS